MSLLYEAKTAEALTDPRWQQSMNAQGYCYDNAFAENCFASIKAEVIPDSGIFLKKNPNTLWQ